MTEALRKNVTGHFACIGSQPPDAAQNEYWHTGKLYVPVESDGKGIDVPSGIARQHTPKTCDAPQHNIVFVYENGVSTAHWFLPVGPVSSKLK